MRSIADAFWRAAAYCLHPRVIALSLLPLAITAVLALGLGWLYWADAVDLVRGRLDAWTLSAAVLDGLDSVGITGMRLLLAPLRWCCSSRRCSSWCRCWRWRR